MAEKWKVGKDAWGDQTVVIRGRKKILHSSVVPDGIPAAERTTREIVALHNAAIEIGDPLKVAANIGAVVEYASKVMATLEQYGGSIVPHLLDTDDNDGQELREALSKLKDG